MNWKSIRFSIYTIIIWAGLLVGTVFLFRIETILGIIGVILILVVPGIFLRKAIGYADARIDRLIAKIITPAICVLIAVGFLASVGFWA